MQYSQDSLQQLFRISNIQYQAWDIQDTEKHV